MESLDAYKNEIISQLLEGDWGNLFPSQIFLNFLDWTKRQKDKPLVAVRFIFLNKGGLDTKYAVYFVCKPSIKNGKIIVQDLKFFDELPLAMPPALYQTPLFNMPANIFEEITKKKLN